MDVHESFWWLSYLYHHCFSPTFIITIVFLFLPFIFIPTHTRYLYKIDWCICPFIIISSEIWKVLIKWYSAVFVLKSSFIYNHASNANKWWKTAAPIGFELSHNITIWFQLLLYTIYETCFVSLNEWHKSYLILLGVNPFYTFLFGICLVQTFEYFGWKYSEIIICIKQTGCSFIHTNSLIFVVGLYIIYFYYQNKIKSNSCIKKWRHTINLCIL